MMQYENCSLKPFHTFGMDVRARKVVEYHTVDELRKVLGEYSGQPMLPVGQGSNLLFTRDYDGIVLVSRMARARALGETKEDVLIEADGGLVLDELIAQLCDMNLCGLENLSGIPGTVGASAVQNVGAYGVEAKDVIQSVRAIEIATGEERVFTPEECRFAYRDSVFKNELRGQYIIIAVTYRLTHGGPFSLEYGNLASAIKGEPTVQKIREAVLAIRAEKLPDVHRLGSAGSFFKNPVVTPAKSEELHKRYPHMPYFPQEEGVKIPAAWLIDTLGWKGKKQGGAQVYEKQPLVLVNTGTAVPEDVMRLAAAITESVKEQFDIEIYPEVNYI